MEMKERKERRRNIVIRGLKVREGRRREAVEEVLEKIGVEVEVKEIRRVESSTGEGREIVLVKLANEEQRREILKKKGGLKGRRERIGEDLTRRERKIRWKIEEIARDEERKRNKVWISYGKIKINERWWIWDEDKERFKKHNGKGKRDRSGGREGKGFRGDKIREA